MEETRGGNPSARRRHRRGTPVAGSPNLENVEEVFESPQSLAQALDAFLAFLQKHYGQKRPRESSPGILGFIVTRLRVRRDPQVTDVEVASEFGQGVAIVLVPLIEAESDADWLKRRDAILTAYWPTLQDAQIRATVQLFRSLTPEGRRALEAAYGKEHPRRAPENERKKCR